ncbi:MAG: helix-turn-helix transcriptional regulator [Oscillibacter sp.]|nr:helix-turn-helix transcriptional regulator [Oscillibacter sp.]
MGERIKKLRKALDLTQQEFCERIGVKRNTIAKYETNRGEPIDAVISLICREFNVSESWLRTGEGEMFVQRSEDDELAAAVERLITGESAEFKRRLINALSTLKDEHWVILEEKLKEIVGTRDAESAAPPLPPAPGDIDAEVAAYRAELEAQRESQEVGSGESTASAGSSDSGKRLA